MSISNIRMFAYWSWHRPWPEYLVSQLDYLCCCSVVIITIQIVLALPLTTSVITFEKRPWSNPVQILSAWIILAEKFSYYVMCSKYFVSFIIMKHALAPQLPLLCKFCHYEVQKFSLYAVLSCKYVVWRRWITLQLCSGTVLQLCCNSNSWN